MNNKLLLELSKIGQTVDPVECRRLGDILADTLAYEDATDIRNIIENAIEKDVLLGLIVVLSSERMFGKLHLLGKGFLYPRCAYLIRNKIIPDESFINRVAYFMAYLWVLYATIGNEPLAYSSRHLTLERKEIKNLELLDRIRVHVAGGEAGIYGWISFDVFKTWARAAEEFKQDLPMVDEIMRRVKKGEEPVD